MKEPKEMEWISDHEFVIKGKVYHSYNRPWLERLEKNIDIDMDKIYEDKTLKKEEDEKEEIIGVFFNRNGVDAIVKKGKVYTKKDKDEI